MGFTLWRWKTGAVCVELLESAFHVVPSMVSDIFANEVIIAKEEDMGAAFL